MSPRACAPLRAPARGFVLVGVVMMVLALTIIGISLYSLSGYESQFFGRTLSDRQALYTASGGVELVKRLLRTPFGSPATYRLSSASLAEGREGIVSAVAWQEGPLDSTGPVDWNKPVKVRVGVAVNGVTRTLEGSFIGTTRLNPYLNLFTCPGVIRDRNGQVLNRPTVLLGSIWQTIRASSDTAWTQYLDPLTRITFEEGDAPEPAAAAFLAAHAPGEPAALSYEWTVASGETTWTTTYIDMDAGPDPTAPRYFYAPPDLNSKHGELRNYFDFVTLINVVVRVRGTAIWVVPRGLKLEGSLTVQRLPGASSAALVMVVGPNERYRPPAPFASEDLSYLGPWLDKGLRITDPNTCAFIVSQGTVRIHRPYVENEAFANAVSVFAHGIEFEGPEYQLPRKNMTLAYAGWMQGIANTLYDAGVLPAGVGEAATEWTLEPGSWTESPGLQ